MAKRKSKKRPAGPAEATRRIWLAGLGALATAEEEGGKVFEDLVKRGRGLERTLADPLADATRRVRATVGEVRTRAGRTLGRIERAVDDGLSATFERLGLASRREIAELGRRVETLDRRLGPAAGAKPRRPPAKAAPRRRTRARTS